MGFLRVRGRIGLAVLAVCVLALAGCSGGDEGAGPAPSSTESLPPDPTPTPVVISFSDITWTTAIDPETREPQDSVAQFPNNAPVIIASVRLEPVPAGLTLTAVWAIDGAEVPEATMTATADSRLQQGWATFQFTREEGHLFPLGDLSVEISAGDGQAVSGEVQIVVPPRSP